MIRFYISLVSLSFGAGLASGQGFTDRSDLFAQPNNPVSAQGVALGDFNADGLLDVYHPRNLYRQLADGRFEEFWRSSGLDAEGDSPVGGVWGDANADGLLDLHIFNSGGMLDTGSHFYRNVDGRRFASGFEPLEIFTSIPVRASVWRDFNGDGFLDLLVSTLEEGARLYAGDATFVYEDIASSLDLELDPSPCGLAVGDFNDDQLVDIFSVGCQSQTLLVNRPDAPGHFEAAAATGITSQPGATGAVAADFNNDGRPDLYVMRETTPDAPPGFTPRDYLYINQGNGRFQDITEEAGLLRSPERSTHAAVAADFDNDGWLDLVLNQNGRITYFRNNTDGTFGEVLIPQTEGLTFDPAMAAGDLNGDGWMDLVIADRFGNVALMNDGGQAGWLEVKLRGDGTNFFGVGATVQVRTGDKVQTRQIAAGTGTRSQSDHLTAHFGLGDADQVDSVRILWPDGGVQEVQDVTPGQTVTVVRDVGVNAPPRSFMTIAPANFAFVDRAAPVIQFDWEDAFDPDSEVEYTLTIKGRTQFSTENRVQVAGLTESGFELDASELEADLVYDWWVSATDGYSVTSTTENTRFSFGYPSELEDRMSPPSVIEFEQWVHGDIAITDIDNDGIEDLVVAGMDEFDNSFVTLRRGQLQEIELEEGNPRSVYTRIGYPVTAQFQGLQGLRSPLVSTGDLELDGDGDIIISGLDFSGQFVQLQSYQFNGRAMQATNEGDTMTPVWGGDSVWADLDENGEQELLMTGSTTAQPPYETFTLLYPFPVGFLPGIQTSLPGMMFGDMDAADFDGDGDLDVAMTGDNGKGGFFSAIYRNDGAGSFVDVGAGLPPLSHGSVSWGDFDHDGDQDLLLSGGALAPEFHRGVTMIYRNDGPGGFQPHFAPMEGVLGGHALWLDFDVDGDLDLISTGSETVMGTPGVQILLNEEGRFQVAYEFPGLAYSSARTWDYDRDGDPDVIMMGLDGLGNPKVWILENTLFSPPFPVPTE